MNKMNTKNQYMLNSFLDNVNKLTPGKSANSQFGRVTCKKAADHSRGFVKHLNRTGYGTRLFSLSKSDYLPSGKYTLGKLRQKLNDAIA